jgi:CRISPR-associated protein Csb1
MTKLTLSNLKTAVEGSGVAFRVRQELQPAGGPGDKIFPPTYATGDNKLKYAGETRRVAGKDVPCVLLDSVASQANRMEEALLAAWEQRQLDFPVIGVDFSGEPELADLGALTTLQAPHRIADAILRDSVAKDGKLFRDTADGQAYTNATIRNATAVYSLCPTALVFGVWDSTGPKGGLGTKFQRALTAEIVGVGASPGRKVSSRIDPLGIQANVKIYHRKDDESDWTIEPSEAKHDKKGPMVFSRKGGEGKGNPSSVNHSNIAPSVDEWAGGVTFDHAVQTVVLSLPALRKLRFVTDAKGDPLGGRAPAATSAARVALAALALAAIVHQRAQGYDLRSRCLLVASGPLNLQLLAADGTAADVALTVEEANALVAEASEVARAAGLAWQREPIKLTPAPKLAALIRRSRAEAAAGVGGEEA